jgi:hypothetical protein
VITGGCQCGEVRYEIHAAPREIYVRHCRECQRRSASAFGISVIVESADLLLTAGVPLAWGRPVAGGTGASLPRRGN